jgi:hypothetical protein
MSTPSAPGATAPSPRLRATTVDRDTVTSLIETSVADGSLTTEEGEDRIRAVRAAVHRDEFAALLADLPVAQPTAAAPAAGRSGALPRIRAFTARRRTLTIVILIVAVLAVLALGLAVGFEWFGDGGHGGSGGAHEQMQHHNGH